MKIIVGCEVKPPDGKLVVIMLNVVIGPTLAISSELWECFKIVAI